MSPEFHQRVRDVFDEALARPAAERDAFVGEACHGDSDLLRAVTELLAAHADADSFLDEPAALRAQRIGRYQLIRELGRGGMGIVYDAVDSLIGRSVAVKVIQLNSLASTLDAQQTWKQLLTEAQSAGLLTHPGIVMVFEFGQEGDTAFIAMERVEGPSLQQVLDQNKTLAGDAGIDLLRQTAAALDYAHQNSVLHRDIKPANIMIHKGTTVKIADFGLAKIMSNPRRTRTQTMMGTPGYMSPERIMMQPLDGRCDQFSLAVIAFQMLTGSKPFEGNSVPEVLFRITSRERPSACDLVPSLPAAVDQVLHRGLAVKAEHRYGTCLEFTEALEESLRSATERMPATAPEAALPPVTPNTPRDIARKKKTRRLVGWIAAGAVAAIVTGVLAVRQFAPSPGAVPANPLPFPITQTPAPPPPSIVRFAAEPDSIEPGAAAKLSWVVSGAAEVEIVPSVGVVPATGNAAVTPSSPTNYLLTATGLRGASVKASVLVDVRPKALPIAAKPRAVATVPVPVNTEARAAQLYQQASEARRSGQASKALELFREAAELGDRRSMLEAGKMYRAGEGTAADVNEAARWFRKAADAGYPPAMVLMGSLYFEGKAYPRDLAEAARWFRKAAEANDPLGMVETGLMYANGFGVTKDDRQAVAWFQKAAEAGSPLGLYHLGRCYEKGAGVARDLNLAAAWYEQAAAAGNVDARVRLEQLRGASKASSAPIRVPGNQPWTSTGIRLKPGDVLSITASGTIAFPAVLRILAMTPAGSASNCQAAGKLYGSPPESPAPKLPCWSLIGRVGSSGPIFAIGTNKTYRADATGELYLGINSDSLQQNTGAWQAAVVKVQ
jgi:serine/threonine-protein kinase